ncbi:DinB family protein [Cryptosporangium sp. NPDC048952]|uniref:DinB family protein n=1 Tax=Cryptosporangium sp. NPDC048952 TaxID=3363961 RepID=UPI00371C4C8A
MLVDVKADLLAYLNEGRDALLFKLDGASEYDVRRPLVPTGTNLLGLVKHMAGVESGYFGATFGRPFEHLPWIDADDAAENADMWATAEESRDAIVGLYRRVQAHANATIDALELNAVGEVPWWGPDRRTVTLHRVLVHVTAEVHRHAGHADILRELVDGAVGRRAPGDNLPADYEWGEYHDRLESVAQQFR